MVPLITVPKRRHKRRARLLGMAMIFLGIVGGLASLVVSQHSMIARGNTSEPAVLKQDPQQALKDDLSRKAVEMTPVGILERTVGAAVPVTKAIATNSGTSTELVHVVRSGDTLSSLAKAYGTSVKAIKSFNQLSTERLTVGTRLRLPPSSPVFASGGS